MKLLREITDQEVFLENTQDDTIRYTLRRAARAVVLNDANQIAILHVTKDHYHKLPGGGVEQNEEIMIALQRELREEVGAEVKVLDEIGVILEVRKKHELIHLSYCYLAKVFGEVGATSFTDVEIKDGFELQWLQLEEAITIIEQDEPTSYLGKFIRERDLTFLRTVNNR